MRIGPTIITAIVMASVGCASPPDIPDRSDRLEIVQKLAVQNCCEEKREIELIRIDANIETYSVTCSDRELEFQCDFEGEITIRGGCDVPYKRVYGKSYKYQPACWLSP